jgi:ATP-dependent Lon protease
VILSKRNLKDLRDVPDEVKSQLKFEFVENASEVLRLALGLEVELDWQGAQPSQNSAPAVA